MVDQPQPPAGGREPLTLKCSCWIGGRNGPSGSPDEREQCAVHGLAELEAMPERKPLTLEQRLHEFRMSPLPRSARGLFQRAKEQLVDDVLATLQSITQERDALRAEQARLRAALDEYGSHLSECGIVGEPGDPSRHVIDHCTCGFEATDDALAQVETPAEPQEQESHRCARCGHRWLGPLRGAEYCGDCHRAAIAQGEGS